MRARSKIAFSVAVLVFVIGLGLFASLGIYNRYWADDWCYNADFKELGYLGTLNGYTYITTYTSSRFSVTALAGLLFFLGIPGAILMTPVNIGLCLAGLYLVLRNVNEWLGRPAGRIELLLAAAMTAYYSIYLAPHLYQSIYWIGGSLTYFSPIVFGAMLFALITLPRGSGPAAPFLYILIAALSFIGGGFSEAGSATLTAALAIYSAVAWLRRSEPWARQSLPRALTAGLFTLAAMTLLIAAPTTAHRAGLYGEPAGPGALIVNTISFSADFVRFSLAGLPLPYLAIAGSGLVLGYFMELPGGVILRPRTVYLAVVMVAAIAFLLIAASFAPSAYIEQAPPHPRTRIIPRFVLTAAIIVVGVMFGLLAKARFRPFPFQAAAAFLLLLSILYAVRTLTIVAGYFPVYAERARLWDARDAEIENARAQQLSEISVAAIDGLPVGGIRDFDVRGEPGYWINKCAARYYGLETIAVGSP